MLYKSEILKGIRYLLSIQNKDGGIPGLRKGDPSACWTTAETLEVTLRASCFDPEFHKFIVNMIHFLLNTQLKETDNVGAWPEYVNKHSSFTFVTGHALSALKLSENIFIDDSDIHNNIKSAIERGFEYLKKVQNTDGGWGLTPELGGEEKKSRAFSTIYVLHGYIQNGFTASSDNSVSKACQYLEGLLDKKTGRFDSGLDKCSDVCYTARIINILIKAKYKNPNSDSLLKKAVNFVKIQSNKTLLSVNNEIFSTREHIGYHNNTPIDVTETLCLCGIFGTKSQHLEKWFIKNQQPDGMWYLGKDRNPKEQNTEIVTWATNDAIYALLCIDEVYSKIYYSKLHKKFRIQRKSIVVLIVFLVASVLFHDYIPSFFSWNTIPKLIKFFISTSIGLALLSNFLWDLIKKFFSFLLDKFHHSR